MRLVPLTAEDEDLTVRLECDPEMMRSIHAYPTVTNAASNAIARKIGMENHGEREARLSQGVFADMVRPQVAVSEADHVSFGLGWLLITALHTGNYVLVHDGSDPGVATMVMLLPKTNRGMVLFTNGDNGERIFTQIIRESLDVGDEIIERLKWE